MIVVAEINVIGLLNHSASRYAASNPFPHGASHMEKESQRTHI